jgi:Heparinase II/III-like protein/Heparinase II/III N-terminus
MPLKQAIGKAYWLCNRLRCMSGAEVLFRFQELATKKAIKYSWLPTAIPMARPAITTPILTFTCPQQGAEAYIQEADAILMGQVPLFAGKSFQVGHPPAWNRDPTTGITSPISYGLELKITNRQLVGDIKYVWELNRHLHLVRLAQAYLLTQNPTYLDGLTTHISSWLVQCPPLRGPNWASSLELAIRLINWSVVWQLLGGWEGVMFQRPGGETLRDHWLQSIFAHCQLISRYFSRHSSANNHLLGELAGLYIATRTWPCWPQAEQWGRAAKTGLQHEALLQYTSDGVHKEQAFSYQLFTLEFLLLAGIYGQNSGDSFADPYWQISHRGLGFVHSLLDIAGRLPMVGDADDGIVLRLQPEGLANRAKVILALGEAVLTDQPAVHGSEWLLGGKTGSVVSMPTMPTDWQFPEGGYLLFGSGFGSPQEIKGLLDCGALGYLGIAAHGHADALAITLSIAGEECLVDAGTYSYWQAQKWRDYFRGTSAHNTVRVDGLDQSVSGGRFMWLHKARTFVDQLPTAPNQFTFTGHHDGYLRLKDPVRHTRTVHYDEASTCLVVQDVVQGKQEHTIEQFWHFGPSLEIVLVDNAIHITGLRFKAVMAFIGDGLSLQLLNGDENLPLGWLSREYGHKQPITVLRVQARAKLVSIETRVLIELLNF